jgi:toxin ParE1/3/4
VSWRLDIRQDALADIEAAVAWYEAQQPGLGADFARTARGAIRSLTEHPLIYRVRDRRRDVRWFLTPRFPYRVFYRVQQESVTVFAVIHAARHDRHWRRRL